MALDLETRELLNKLPTIRMVDEQPTGETVVQFRFVLPKSNWAWYVVAANRTPDGDLELYGVCTSDGFEFEWGSFWLSQFEEKGVQLDSLFEPRPMGEIKLLQSVCW